MLPIQFALELETSISDQIATSSGTATDAIAPVIALVEGSQVKFTLLLSSTNTMKVDIVPYPVVDESQLLGPDTAWQQLSQNIIAANASLQDLTILWSIYTTIDKSVQFYQQAATNSAYPQARLFFSSLNHTKKILRRKLAGIIQIYYNHYWGELGFAPFLLGKD